MSHKKSGKRKRTEPEDDSWECSVCTYRNKRDGFKCDMCDTRKGTSTRKPKLSTNFIEQQEIVEKFVVQNAASSTHHNNNHAHNSSKESAHNSSGGSRKGRGATLSPSLSPAISRQSSVAAASPTEENKSLCGSNPPSPPPPLSAPVLSTNGTVTPTTSPAKLIMNRAHSTCSSAEKAAVLKGIDRNSARTVMITVNNSTVAITDYKLKPPKESAAKKGLTKGLKQEPDSEPKSESDNHQSTANPDDAQPHNADDQSRDVSENNHNNACTTTTQNSRADSDMKQES